MPTPTGSTIRATWLATGAATAVVVAVTAVVWMLLTTGRKPAPPPEAGYLLALKDAGLFDQFNSEENAVAHGHHVCRQLEDGGPQQGLPADKLAVDAFCPQFSEGFRVLETAHVTGTFVLADSDGVGAIEVDGGSCQGSGGYADVDHSTPVTVTDGAGRVLAVTSLGPGKGDTATCTFSFGFPITEGQDRYVVAIGRRGTFPYSFEHLRARGVQIRLGH
ncbi:DUF732 domain-containing protein [Mycolicibacterium chubuense]|uniref:DUF732 domain-containing protein n=1 Tax=Mycolicibacterium chubuense TaxID=1800 RepID=UPI0002FCAC3E|nr:DUF732 domain-containing protein [Mycolicibacterium chubuense]